MLKIDKNTCTGCGMCAGGCSFGAIAMVGDIPAVSDACVICGECAKSCPVGAISMPGVNKMPSGLDAYADVWVLMEVNRKRGQLQKVSLELLSEARILADRLNQKTAAVLLCAAEPDRFVEALAEVGCDHAYIVKHRELEIYDTNLYADVIAKLVQAKKPAAMLYPASEFGRDLAPRTACKLGVGLTADCTALDIDADKNLLQIRPTYGGNIMASIISPNHRPQFASVRPNVLRVNKSGKPSPVEVSEVAIEVNPRSRLTRLVGFEEKKSVCCDVTESDIVITGGYGLGSAENFALVQKLAVRMNAAIGATRKAVDEGWAPGDMQVGQTGKTIAPELYIACGVSGALQHSIAIKNAKHVIAINTDPAAPIFSMSDVAILGDAVKIVQLLCERVEHFGADSVKSIK